MTKEEIENELVNHRQRNAELLDLLRKKGLAENDEVNAEYHFWAFDHEDSVILAKRLYERAFTILVISPVENDGEITWNIEAGKLQTIKEVISDVNIAGLLNLANDHNAIFDGWGTKV